MTCRRCLKEIKQMETTAAVLAAHLSSIVALQQQAKDIDVELEKRIVQARGAVSRYYQ